MINPETGVQYSILCIEDDNDIRTEIIHELTASGFLAIAACDGEQALIYLATSRPDLILCDVLMPGISGLDLYRHLRQEQPQLSSVPFIFLTALSDRTHVLEGLKLGADDYLTKPVDYDILITKIRNILGLLDRSRGEKDKPAMLSKIRLTNREKQVLTKFAHGLTNAEIARALDLSEHTITDYTKAIFKKLEVTSRAHAVLEAIAQGLIEKK